MISSPEAPVVVTIPETTSGIPESPITNEPPKTPENGQSLMSIVQSLWEKIRPPKKPEQPDRSAEAPYEVPKSDAVKEAEMSRYQAHQEPNI